MANRERVVEDLQRIFRRGRVLPEARAAASGHVCALTGQRRDEHACLRRHGRHQDQASPSVAGLGAAHRRGRVWPGGSASNGTAAAAAAGRDRRVTDHRRVADGKKPREQAECRQTPTRGGGRPVTRTSSPGMTGSVTRKTPSGWSACRRRVARARLQTRASANDPTASSRLHIVHTNPNPIAAPMRPRLVAVATSARPPPRWPAGTTVLASAIRTPSVAA